MLNTETEDHVEAIELHDMFAVSLLFPALTVFSSSTLSKAVISMHESSIPQCS